jgi:hypothetical protein
MAYNKAHVQAAGNAVLQVIDAVKDGLDASDVGAAITLLTAITDAADEFRGDTDAAILHLVATIADGVGDDRVNPSV